MISTFCLGDMGEAVIKLGLESVYNDPRVVPKTMSEQLEWGDIACRGCSSIGIPNKKIEVKTEVKHTGNLFFETVSNDHISRDGWAITSPADELYYLFWEDAIGYRIPEFQRVKWLFDFYKNEFKEVKQRKHEQHNLTIGRLVPVDWVFSLYVKATNFEFSHGKKLVEAMANAREH